MSIIQRLLIREYAEDAAKLVCESAIADLKNIKVTLSGDDSGLNNAWEEICVQVQGEESFFWDAYQDTIHDTVQGILDQLSHRDLAALWLQTEEGSDWHWDVEWEEEHKPRSERGEKAPSVPICNLDIVRYIVGQFVLPAAESFTNPYIEFYLDAGDPSEAMRRRLVELMPLDSKVMDLWNLDIHFEEESFDDIKSAAFCDGREIEHYAESLAEDFEQWIEEYSIDYNQNGWDTPEAFSAWVKEQCVDFMKRWRTSVREEFGR